MNIAFVPLISIPMLALGYFTYGRWLSRRVFGAAADRPTPAVRLNDGRDFVPTHSAVLFGHHFATIAGAGPIVGPILAVVYGWAPAWLWLMVGAVFMGALHDFAALFVSAREDGRSVAEVVRKYLGNTGYFFFMAFLLMMLALITAAFLNITAISLTSTLSLDDLKVEGTGTVLKTRWVAGASAPARVGADGAAVPASDEDLALTPAQRDYPRLTAEAGEGALAAVERAPSLADRRGVIVTTVPAQGARSARTVVVERHGVIGGIASMSVIVITIFAPLLGWLLVKRRIRIWLAFLLAGAACAVSIACGISYPVQLEPTQWMLCISVYTLFAAGIPVWVFLQPRDFTNVQILYVGIAILTVGIFAAGLGGATMNQTGQIPAWNASSEQASAFGPIFPLLFITVACGAISGFHAVVAGGTTSKQLRSEGAALRIGYGGMLLESLFAILVMVALCGSLSAQDYLREVHPLAGKGNPSLAFAHGVGNLLFNAFALSPAYGCIAGIILIEGFAATTLDSAVRLQRYLLEELWAFLFRGNVPRALQHYMVNSGIAVALMLVLAFSGGFKAVWAVFGTGNQLLAALTLLAVSVWLLYHGRGMWVALIPACLMCAMTVTALVLLLLKNFGTKGGVSQFNATLFVAELFLLVLAAGMIAYAVKFFAAHARRVRAGQ